MPKVLLVIEQGATFNTNIELTDDNNDALDVTGYTARASMKKHHQQENATAAFVCTLTTGQLNLSMNAATTSSLTPVRHVWNAELITPTNAVIRLAEGVALVTPDVAPATLTLTSTPSVNTQVGVAYNQLNTGDGGTGTVTFDVVAGSLLANTSLNVRTGTVSGTPTTAGAFSYTIRATDSGSPVQTANQVVSGTVTS